MNNLMRRKGIPNIYLLPRMKSGKIYDRWDGIEKVIKSYFINHIYFIEFIN